MELWRINEVNEFYEKSNLFIGINNKEEKLSIYRNKIFIGQIFLISGRVKPTKDSDTQLFKDIKKQLNH